MRMSKPAPVKKLSSGKVSLLERRKQTITSLPQIKEFKNPVKSLKDGVYDIRPNDPSMTCETGGIELDQKISAFLEEENVYPVLLNQYVKDLQQYKLAKWASEKRSPMFEEDHAMTEQATPPAPKNLKSANEYE